MASADSRWRSMASSGDDVTMDDDHQPVRSVMEASPGGNGKRPRTQTDLTASDIEYVEENLPGALSEPEWEVLEAEFKKTTTVIIFSMSESSLEVEKCTLTIAHLRGDILNACRASGVFFDDNKLKIETSTRNYGAKSKKTTSYLSGHPIQLDQALWSLLKPGYLSIKGVNIWVQPVFTGRKNTSLTLNELEYVNSNRVSYLQLLGVLRSWGVTDALIVSHGTYFDRRNIRQESRRGACDCLQVAVYTSPDIAYSFRLFFASADEASRVYKAYLDSHETDTFRHGDPTSTMILKPVPQSEWDSSLEVMYRPSDREAKGKEFRIGIFGLRIEIKPHVLERILEEYSLGKVQIEIRGSQPLFAIGKCSSQEQMDDILQQYGPDGVKRFKYKKISLYLRRWETTPPKHACRECGDFGHSKSDCPRLTKAGPPHQNQDHREVRSKYDLQRDDISSSRMLSISEHRIDEKLNQMISARMEHFERRFEDLDRQQRRTDDALANLSVDVKAAVTGLNDGFDRLLQTLSGQMQHFGGGGQDHQ